MSIRNVAARVPRTTTTTLRHSIQMPRATATRLGGTRSVGGTSMPKPDTPPNKGSNVPIAIAAVAAVAGATYFVTRSSQQHGENIVRDAKEKPHVKKVGEPGQPGHPAGAGTAYKLDGERTDGKGGRGLAGEITQQEISSSISQGLKTDAPKTAYESEEKGNLPTTGRSPV